jgi:hypothetical protein
MIPRLFILILVCSFILPVQSQTRIQKFTLEKIDTSLSQYEQVEQIYEWIASNIKYDVRSFENHTTKKRTPLEVIKDKKALCYEYSCLFNEMCRAVGIKSYMVYGYVKGFGYQEGQTFLRTNHTWNVVRIDSSYILIDPTWGSGSLYTKPAFTVKVMNTFFHTPYAETRIKFHHEPTKKYFNISPDELVKTHLPLDPVWQFKDPALSFDGFTGNDSDKYVPSDYKIQLTFLNNKGEYYKNYLEGVKGKEFNKNNNFDIAKNTFDFVNNKQYFSKDVDTDNLISFGTNLDLYDKAGEYITEHKFKTDSVYKYQSKTLKTLDNKTVKLKTKIGNKEKRAKKTLRKSLLKLDKKEYRLDGKIAKYENKVVDLVDRKFINKKRFKSPDNECQIYDLFTERDVMKSGQNMLKPLAYRDYLQIDTCIENEKKVCENIHMAQEKMQTDISKAPVLVSVKSDRLLLQLMDTVYNDYNELMKLYLQQKMKASQINGIIRSYNKRATEIEKLYKNEINIFRKLLPLTSYNDTVFILYQAALDELIKEHEQTINFYYLLITYNTSLMKYKSDDREELKNLKRKTKKELRFISKYAQQRKNWVDGEYKSEKENISSLARTIKSEGNILRKKIKDFEEKNDSVRL